MTHPNRRILLIDDTPSIHDDFRKILAPEPHPDELDPGMDGDEQQLFGQSLAPSARRFELDSAYQGQQGVQRLAAALAQGRPYAMAFVDMRMPPGWDGVETIEQLWRIDPRLQVVICTAHADLSWEQILGRLDVQDRLLIVKKPFDMIEVGQLAVTLTGKWELARRAQAHLESLERTVQNLQASESALRRSNEELEVFAQSLSHDLRSPLGVISAFCGVLARELQGHPSGKVEHYLARIQASALRGEQLIEGLLVLDRVSRAPLSIEGVDLTQVAGLLLDEHRRAEPRRQVLATVQAGLTVQGDRRLAMIVMRQLLDNAWKFSLNRGDAHIEVGLRPGAGAEPVFFVRDNGCGFDMAYADKLFRPFQRLHAYEEFPGTGVGLVTARRALARHGGRIWAESRPDQGATFYFTLPSTDGQALPPWHRLPQEESGAA